MIAQLNTHPRNTLTLHNQIRIVNTIPAEFGTEIVADALKIAATGRRVLIVQLLKGGIRQGHDRVMNLAQNLDWIRCNLIRNISIPDLNDLELHNFHQLWKHVCGAAKTSEYSLLILDDLSMSIDLGLISIEAVTDFLTTLPDELEVILTGNSSHPAVLKLVNGG